MPFLILIFFCYPNSEKRPCDRLIFTACLDRCRSKHTYKIVEDISETWPFLNIETYYSLTFNISLPGRDTTRYAPLEALHIKRLMVPLFLLC